MGVTTVVKTCDYGACGKPFETRDKRQRYCIRACVWADARAKLNAMRDSGTDPTKGGAAADARVGKQLRAMTRAVLAQTEVESFGVSNER